MRLFRRHRLPNETGGVLLGEVDNVRRVVYVAAVLPSPADSIEWPTAYVRGAKGLRERINEVQRSLATRSLMLENGTLIRMG